ncbi:MAG: 50S ribosomal protein L11 methyltransferase, partial [Endomicrobia bacterium]|nr:50S ribosomal protein L11 methyltransferase [Endomicrobiia bacterium]
MKFNFGLNWFRYVKNVVNIKTIFQARNSLLKYLDESSYKGKTFIDVGCGSGIFSLSAILLGCRKVISFDYDIQSVQTTKLLKEKFKYLLPSDVEWTILQADILDDNLVEKFKNVGDIVYCWGVLH